MKFTIASIENMREDRPEDVIIPELEKGQQDNTEAVETVGQLAELMKTLPSDQDIELSFQQGFEAEMVSFTQIDDTDPAFWVLRPSTSTNPDRAYAWAYHGHGSAYTYGIVSRRDWNKLHGILHMHINGKRKYFLVCSNYMRNASATVAKGASQQGKRAMGIAEWSLSDEGKKECGDVIAELSKQAIVDPVDEKHTALCTIGVGDAADGRFMSGWMAPYNVIKWRTVRRDSRGTPPVNPEVIRNGVLTRP